MAYIEGGAGGTPPLLHARGKAGSQLAGLPQGR